LEEAFLRANLPYKLVGAQRFYGRREIKDVIAYLRLVHNFNDELSLSRVINVPARGIGDKTLLALRTQAQKAGMSPGQMLLELGTNSDSPHLEALSSRAARALSEFGAMLAGWMAVKDDLTPLELVDRILDDTAYHAYIDDGSDEGADRWENVMELRRLAAEYQDQGLEAFLEQIALVSDQDTLDASANAPTLLTLHAAKGLEFPVVFIVGLNDGTLPHSRSFEDPEAMMEERRLFYVGITRAKDHLYLVYAQNRSSYGFNEPSAPSRFLADIPSDLVSGTGAVEVRTRRGRASYRPERWGVSPEPTNGETQPLTNQYEPGMRVEHPTWGEGMVLNSRLQDDDEIVDIFFEELGLKRVAASLARLEIKQ
jgi:DNA helicase-2/ATP-dependent DNA helicase PcrA